MLIQLLGVLLGALIKLRKATIGLVMSACLSVCPSVCKEQLRSHWTDFYEIFSEDFPKMCRKIQVSSKSNTNNGYFR